MTESLRQQENKFKPFIASAVERHLHSFSNLQRGAVLSTTEEDTRLSFDMRVGLWIPVSVRLRTAKYWRYRDFSIRCKTRFSGQVINGEMVKCEIDKLRDGLGNCYFTGWLTEDQERIANYLIVDVNRLRPHLDSVQFQERDNWDGTAGRYYPLDVLQRIGALVYQSWDEAEAA